VTFDFRISIVIIIPVSILTYLGSLNRLKVLLKGSQRNEYPVFMPLFSSALWATTFPINHLLLPNKFAVEKVHNCL